MMSLRPFLIPVFLSLSALPAAAQPIIFLPEWGTFGTAAGEFNDPFGVAVDGAGDVYVVDSNNDRVQKFDASGSFLTEWGGAGSAAGEFVAPFGMSVDGAGDVYSFGVPGPGSPRRNHTTSGELCSAPETPRCRSNCG